MAQSDPETLETELLNDLRTLTERFRDEEFSSDLYRALSSTVWRKQDGPEGRVSFSFNRAEELVNAFRGQQGAHPLTLAQAGGEGEVSPVVHDELGTLGWTHRPLNTDRNDPTHLGQPEGDG